MVIGCKINEPKQYNKKGTHCNQKTISNFFIIC